MREKEKSTTISKHSPIRDLLATQPGIQHFDLDNYSVLVKAHHIEDLIRESQRSLKSIPEMVDEALDNYLSKINND